MGGVVYWNQNRDERELSPQALGPWSRFSPRRPACLCPPSGTFFQTNGVTALGPALHQPGPSLQGQDQAAASICPILSNRSCSLRRKEKKNTEKEQRPRLSTYSVLGISMLCFLLRPGLGRQGTVLLLQRCKGGLEEADCPVLASPKKGRHRVHCSVVYEQMFTMASRCSGPATCGEHMELHGDARPHLLPPASDAPRQSTAAQRGLCTQEALGCDPALARARRNPAKLSLPRLQCSRPHLPPGPPRGVDENVGGGSVWAGTCPHAASAGLDTVGCYSSISNWLGLHHPCAVATWKTGQK